MNDKRSAGRQKRYVFSLGLSLMVHASLLSVGVAAAVPKMESSLRLSRPLRLELESLSILQSAPLSSETDGIRMQDRGGKHHEKVSTPVNQDLIKMQKEIDEKIAAIRQRLHDAVNAQTERMKPETVQGFQVVSGGEKGPQWDSYLNSIRRKVLEAWYPRLVESEDQLVKSEVRLDFTVSETGDVLEYTVSEWKGSKKFCDLSLDAFVESLPFHPPPRRVGAVRKKGEGFALSLFFYYQ